MGFWLKRVIIILLVIVGAAVFILFMPEQSAVDEQGNPIEKKSIQSNMAKFYEEFSLVSSDKIEEKYGDFVIPLELSDVSLSNQLKALNRSSVDGNENFDWRGSAKPRAFAKDSTLMNNAETYVNEEGLELLWHLNQDFIVQSRFITNSTVSGMLTELAGAIDSNFVGTVKVFYCEQQRVLVISDKNDQVLQNDCRLVE